MEGIASKLIHMVVGGDLSSSPYGALHQGPYCMTPSQDRERKRGRRTGRERERERERERDRQTDRDWGVRKRERT
jgi:hypothetical protein